MKHFYILYLFAFLFLSCSDTEPVGGTKDPDPNSFEACFSISSESIFVGESVEISNCSEGASTYAYDFGNGSSSSESNPEVIYSEGGSYTITLTVKNSNDETKQFSQEVNVIAPESYYLYPTVPDG